MEIEIIIQESSYFSSMDEDSFYKRLESISAVKSVRGNLRELVIIIITPISHGDLHELISLLKRYKISLSYLNKLLQYCDDVKWFLDHKGFCRGLFKKIKKDRKQKIPCLQMRKKFRKSRK